MYIILILNIRYKNGVDSISKESLIEAKGQVIKALPNTEFVILLESGQEVIGYLSGRLRKNYIRILEGDIVDIELSPYNLKSGRITFRY